MGANADEANRAKRRSSRRCRVQWSGTANENAPEPCRRVSQRGDRRLDAVPSLARHRRCIRWAGVLDQHLGWNRMSGGIFTFEMKPKLTRIVDVGHDSVSLAARARFPRNFRPPWLTEPPPSDSAVRVTHRPTATLSAIRLPVTLHLRIARDNVPRRVGALLVRRYSRLRRYGGLTSGSTRVNSARRRAGPARVRSRI